MRDLPWSLHTTSAPLGIKGRGVSAAKQIRDAGGIQALHICPATGNAPTRMTRASWDRLCAATQQRSRERECIDKNQAQLMRMTRRLNVCAWCQGKILPRGLEFIDAAEMAELIKPKEEEMAKQSKLGVCENCGDKGALTGSFGRQVCTTCLKIRSNVNSHLERVAKAAREMGKAEQLLAALVPDGGGLAIKVTADLLQEISGIVGYEGEDPGELVDAVRKSTALAAHQLISEAETGALRTISGIVGYEGTDGEQLVEAVRRQVLTCASCEAEDVLAEIREIVGYSPDMGDSGLADAVRRAAGNKVARSCADCTTLRGDLLRACGLEMDDTEDGEGWDTAAAAAVQTIGELTNRRDDLLALLTRERADNARLYEEKINRANVAFLHTVGELKDEIVRLNNQAQSEPEWVTQLRDELTRTGAEVEQLRERLQASESRLIWYRAAIATLRERLGLDHLEEDDDVMERMLEAIAGAAHAISRHQSLATSAEERADYLQDQVEQLTGASEVAARVERELRAEVDRLREQVADAACITDETPLLDIALAVIREEPVPAEQIAGLIEAARRAAA